ncbi:baseplate assembly protein [Rhizobium halophytocola]|uniref:Phage baseplate assembly protein gpV n=1 Tax=Rhizobium halophytocola TaxID=735519 RepID=A0ABS4E2F8_9HYPH|nr:baseplate assembly protein [Rhizobium halophytocola]MBP1852121.1 phage baseplate assembly protein gpV [Rhizobium halophytocola]
MINEFVAMRLDLEMLKTAVGNSLKVGPVEQIDKDKGYRLRLGGTDEDPYLSPWYPHPETGKTSVPLNKGQIVGVINPSGDPRQGLVFRGGYSDEHSSPNADMAANVFKDAGVTVTVADGALKIEAGGVSLTVSGDGLSISGGHVTHDGKNIGATHIHGGVMPGGATTAVPAN